MTINQGLLSLVNSSPNFSNQALENAINDIKSIDKDDGHQFILSQFNVDTAIRDNTILTTSQKNDALETLYAAQPHLHIGRYLNDVIRHTNTILDGSILPVVAGTENFPQGTFLEILQLVQSIQTLIPQLYGVSASEKSRDVNDHLGSLNNMFIDTEDSSEPVFTRLKRIMQLIDTTSRANTVSGLNLAITNAAAGNLNLKTFLATLSDDSTDFQQSLDNMVNLAANKYSTLQTRLSEIAGDPTTDLVAIREEIITQVNLENSNVSGIRTYVETLSNNIGYTSLAEDNELRKLMARVSQTSEWRDYFENYETRKNNLNPVYNVGTDSDKITIIERVMLNRGLPDVTDYVNLDAVATKTKNDSRIDTKDFEKKTSEQIITAASNQLGITTANRSIYNQSRELLNKMNEYDKQLISDELDANQTADTIT